MIPTARTLILSCSTLLPILLPIQAGPTFAADAGDPDARARACAASVLCRRPPGAQDRDVRPFDGTLGRPCGVRWRETPSGTRRVRVCA